MMQRSIVTASMPAAAFRRAGSYFPPLCFVSLPSGELTEARHLLRLQERKCNSARQKIIDVPAIRCGWYGRSFDGRGTAKIGREVSGGGGLVDEMAIRERHDR